MSKLESCHSIPTAAVLYCSACGVAMDAVCSCGAPYVPAGQRAEAAVKANPEKSDRAIAEEIGVGTMTVSRARKAGVPCGAPAKRKGKDGKSYPATRSPKTDTVRKIIRPSIETGKPVNATELAQQLGISHDTVSRAVLQEHARLEGLNGEHSEITVSIHVLIEKLVPLAERVKEQSERHVGLISTGELRMIASEIRRLLDSWASDDETIRRVSGHVVPGKPPARRM